MDYQPLMGVIITTTALASNERLSPSIKEIVMRHLHVHSLRLFVVGLLLVALWYQPVATRAAGQTSRQLPAVVRFPQYSPDLTVNNLLASPPLTGDFNGDGLDDFLINYPLPCFECGSVGPVKFGIFFGKRDAQFV